MTNHAPYFFALTSAILFSGASVIFARFSRSHSAIWMNTVKNTVAFFAFGLTSLLLHLFSIESWHSVSLATSLYFIGSGITGLAIGDIFLFQGFKRIGSARCLMVFSFAPLLLSLEGYVFFGQSLSMYQFYALLLMMACVWTISFEQFLSSGHWEWRGIVYAVIGVFLDNIGVLLSRKGFDLSPGTNAFTVNVFRSLAAIVPLFIAQYFLKQKIWPEFKCLKPEEKRVALGASFFGTFLSLSLWHTALKVGHIGSLAGVSSFNPVSASIWEWVLGKKRPTIYLCIALIFFLSGFALLLTV